ncbi:hypothetical protein BV898_07349 [Hypsibius exemplaris]|uniref:HORMA domain-containing protein n=1 Tax=Hypsibius exemplaris TaxID=2072580 RepID=A0A1W0WTJ7_HYPEX|nr:hypothetical protein BV898_07349 [Hypsibius exemplaris]
MEVEASSARLTESAQLIIDCLENVIPYILYKRMVYPRSDFQDVHKFGMGLVTLRDPELTRYISLVLKTAHDCALKGVLRRVVLCIIRITTRDVLERWQFRVLPNGRISLSQTGSGEQQTPHSNETHGEIAQIIKQIECRSCRPSTTNAPSNCCSTRPSPGKPDPPSPRTTGSPHIRTTSYSPATRHSSRSSSSSGMSPPRLTKLPPKWST